MGRAGHKNIELQDAFINILKSTFKNFLEKPVWRGVFSEMVWTWNTLIRWTPVVYSVFSKIVSENFLNNMSNFTRTLRSSHQRCSLRKYVLRNFTKFTGILNFVIFVRTPFLIEHLRWLHLKLTSVFKNLL